MIAYEKNVLIFLVALWVLSEIIGAQIIPRLRQKGRVKSRGDRGSLFLVWLGLYSSIFLTIYLSEHDIGTLPTFFFYVGIVLMLCGVGFRQWAIWVLGGFFSIRVRIVSGHRIVEEGPYRVLRHPSYTGMLMTMVGFGLLLRTLLGVIATVALFAVVMGYRMNVEENLLKAEFGEEYRDYEKRTRRLIPFIY